MIIVADRNDIPSEQKINYFCSKKSLFSIPKIHFFPIPKNHIFRFRNSFLPIPKIHLSGQRKFILRPNFPTQHMRQMQNPRLGFERERQTTLFSGVTMRVRNVPEGFATTSQ